MCGARLATECHHMPHTFCGYIQASAVCSFVGWDPGSAGCRSKQPALPASRLCFPVCSSHVGVHPSGSAEGGWGLRHYYLTPLCICCGRSTHTWPMPGARVCCVRAARGIKSNCSSFAPSRSSHRPHCLQSLCAVMLACVAQLTAGPGGLCQVGWLWRAWPSVPAAAAQRPCIAASLGNTTAARMRGGVRGSAAGCQSLQPPARTTASRQHHGVCFCTAWQSCCASLKIRWVSRTDFWTVARACGVAGSLPSNPDGGCQAKLCVFGILLAAVHITAQWVGHCQLVASASPLQTVL